MNLLRLLIQMPIVFVLEWSWYSYDIILDKYTTYKKNRS